MLRQRSMRVAKGPFVALALANTFGAARLGMIIGKRHLSRAVDRNRVKRAIRESFRRHHARLPSLDIVIQLARETLADDARLALDGIWQRLSEVRQ